MEDSKQGQVYQILQDLKIEYQSYSHRAVYTISETEEILPDVKNTHCKNLFLRDNNGKNHYLVMLTSDKEVDLKHLSDVIESSRLSFASLRRLNKYLALDQGAVSPFGLINDINNEVEVIIDHDLKKQSQLTLHPNINTESVTISYDDLILYLDWVGNTYQFVDIGGY